MPKRKKLSEAKLMKLLIGRFKKALPTIRHIKKYVRDEKKKLKGSSFTYDPHFEAINHLHEMIRGKQLRGASLKTYVYKKLANAYRSRFCNGKARMLKDGEFHPLCANYEGPGTRIQDADVRNYPPYNEVDACSRTHDLDYEAAGKEKDQKKKEQLIREADEKVLKCYDKHKNEQPYYTLGKLGISGKMKVEDLIPLLVKKVAPDHFGSKHK